MKAQIRRNIFETSSSSASALSIVSSAGVREHVRLNKTWTLISAAFDTGWDGCPHIYLNRWEEKMSLLANDEPMWHNMFKKATGQDFVMYRLYENSYGHSELPPSEAGLEFEGNFIKCAEYGYRCGTNFDSQVTALRDFPKKLMRENVIQPLPLTIESYLTPEELPKYQGDSQPDEWLLEEIIFNPGIAVDIGGDAFENESGVDDLPSAAGERNSQFRKMTYSVFDNIYRNGNETLILGVKGTKLRLCPSGRPQPEYPDSIDVKITDWCDHGCPFCYEGCTPEGKNGEIPDWLFRQIPPFTELAIGGGNAYIHPVLLDLPERFSLRMNLTLHAKDFIRIIDESEYNNFKSGTDHDAPTSLDMLKKFGAVGVSVTCADDAREIVTRLGDLSDPGSQTRSSSKIWERRRAMAVNLFSEKITEDYVQPVFHVINGIADKEIISTLSDKGYRLLVLGYKTKGRGVGFAADESVARNQRWLYDNIEEVAKHFAVTAFDALALQQLDIRRFFTDDDWEHFYMGGDGQHSMYIDLVKQEYGVSSTDDRRFPLTRDLREMFRHVRELSSENK